jgi:hypothetical protein
MTICFGFFGTQPQQFSLMGMITIPMPWSTKMNKANISYHIKMKVSIGKRNDI